MKILGSFIELVLISWNKVKAKMFTVLLSKCFFAISKKTTIIPPFRFRNLSQIQLGNHVTINQNCWVQVLKSKNGNKRPKIIIKDYASIGMNATISAAKLIVIEENVFTAPNVYISDHGHEYRDVNIPIARQGIRKIAAVRIGANSWLGQNTVILPGVSIGMHCIIGANSVVNSNIPDYCVAAGVPAKLISRYNQKTACWEKSSTIG